MQNLAIQDQFILQLRKLKLMLLSLGFQLRFSKLFSQQYFIGDFCTRNVLSRVHSRCLGVTIYYASI